MLIFQTVPKLRQFWEEQEARSDGERRAYSGSAKQRMPDEYNKAKYVA